MYMSGLLTARGLGALEKVLDTNSSTVIVHYATVNYKIQCLERKIVEVGDVFEAIVS